METARIDRDKTTVTPSQGLSCSKGMTFGMLNGSQKLQSEMITLWMKIKWQFALVNLGDIVKFLQVLFGHIDQARQVRW